MVEQEKQARIEARKARIAFNTACEQGRLSDIETDDNYAGKYMFMGYYNQRDNFKNINTRAYDV